MNTDSYEWHIRELKKWYVNALPEQRAATAMQRLRNDDPNTYRLVSVVGMVEALARSITARRGSDESSDIPKNYAVHESTEVVELVSRLIAVETGQTPEAFFGDEVWSVFQYAVQYRNVSVHEAVFLESNRTADLFGACTEVAGALMKLFGISLPPVVEAPRSDQQVAPQGAASDPFRVALVTRPDEPLTKLFDWGNKFTQLLITAGYVGFLTAWGFTREFMSDNTERAVALLFVISLGTYILWNVFNSIRMTYFSFRFGQESEQPERYPDALDRAVKRLRNPGGPYEWILLTVILPLTYLPAIAGACVMLSALAHGLFKA